MYVSHVCATVIALSLALASHDANCSPVYEPHVKAAISARIIEGKPALAPFQHARFCMRYPSDCRLASTGDDSIDQTPGLLATLNTVNHDANTEIRPFRKDYKASTAERWEISPGAGDCNDYAVTKRHLLLEKRLPSAALKLAVVRTISGEGHLVLVVSTKTGDLVLDNLASEIKVWNTTNYQWIKIQSEHDPRVWHDVADASKLADSNNRAPALQIARR